MTRHSEIQSHIASMGELLEIVGAMRSLAGMRVQESQYTLTGIRSYAGAMAAGIASALMIMAQPVTAAHQEPGRRALILCTAEHGFVGGFNEHLLNAAEATLKPSDLLFVLGSRGAALACERGLRITWTRSMATRLAGAPDAVDRLISALYPRIASGEVARVEVMFGRYRQGAALTVERRLLLPLDTEALVAEPGRQPPLRNLPAEVLLEKLMAEYVIALLTEAAVESIASENTARFAAMESAHDNIKKKLAGLQANARQTRQAEITAELLDLITGVEATQTGSSLSSPGRDKNIRRSYGIGPEEALRYSV